MALTYWRSIPLIARKVHVLIPDIMGTELRDIRRLCTADLDERRKMCSLGASRLKQKHLLVMNPLQPNEVTICVVDERAPPLEYLLNLLPNTLLSGPQPFEECDDLFGGRSHITSIGM